MRSSTAALILAFVSAMAVTAAPIADAQVLQARAQLEAEVAAADAQDTRVYAYDASGNDAPTNPGHKRATKAAATTESAAQMAADVAAADAADTRTEGDDNLPDVDPDTLPKDPDAVRRRYEAEVRAADALDTRTFENHHARDDRGPVKRWIQDFVERAITPGATFHEG